MRMRFALAGLVAALVATGAAHAQDFKPRIVRFGYGLVDNSNQGRAVRFFAQEVEKARPCVEFEILRHLASRPGRVYSRRELLELLRDYEALDQDEKTINVHVSHLRDKIEDDPSAPQFVLTVRGAGYQFAER